MDVAKRKAAVAGLSVASNATLVVAKLVVGLLIGSVSVLSEAIHSAVDLVASIIALVAVRAAGKPPDDRHAYGHGKIENLSGTVEAILIFGAAVWIVAESVEKLMAKEPVESIGLGVGVMAISAVMNWFVSRMLFKVGKETDSVALQADGWHLRTDVWTSAGVFGGLLVVGVAGWLFPKAALWWIDPAAAIGVALLIFKAAWDLTRHALRDLLDESLPAEELGWIEEQIRTYPGVRDMHKLRTRKAGANRFIDFHVQVDPSLPTIEAHEITREIYKRIRERYPAAILHAHVEPYHPEQATAPATPPAGG